MTDHRWEAMPSAPAEVAATAPHQVSAVATETMRRARSCLREGRHRPAPPRSPASQHRPLRNSTAAMGPPLASPRRLHRCGLVTLRRRQLLLPPAAAPLEAVLPAFSRAVLHYKASDTTRRPAITSPPAPANGSIRRIFTTAKYTVRNTSSPIRSLRRCSATCWKSTLLLTCGRAFFGGRRAAALTATSCDVCTLTPRSRWFSLSKSRGRRSVPFTFEMSLSSPSSAPLSLFWASRWPLRSESSSKIPQRLRGAVWRPRRTRGTSNARRRLVLRRSESTTRPLRRRRRRAFRRPHRPHCCQHSCRPAGRR